MSELPLPTTDMKGAETASRLLELQQMSEAWDRLCNEELSELRKEFSQLTAHYLQEYQATRRPGQPQRQWRTDRPPQGTR